jgi:hypothetical protein
MLGQGFVHGHLGLSTAEQSFTNMISGFSWETRLQCLGQGIEEIGP